MSDVGLTAYHVRIPLRRPIRHASHSRDSTDNLIVRCRLPGGIEGWGEGVPRDYVTGETIDSTIELLERSELWRQIQSCDDLASATSMMDRLTLDVGDDDRGIRGNAARCALEIAVLDAAARKSKQPLSAITSIVAPDLAAHRATVQYSGAIASARRLRLRILLAAYRWQGFQQVKVKVGMADRNDVSRLRTIRRLLGRKVELRLDANEAWSAANAADRIHELEPFAIECVEQPVPHEEVFALAELRRNVRTPIMLDESLCGMADAERAVRDGLCDRFNLRLSKCGGFIASLKLAQFARRYGLSAQLGCQVGETAILSAAGRHFATSVGGLTAIEGSFDRHLVRAALGDRDITFGRGGWAPALTGPGLGIEIDQAALANVTVREVPILA